MAHLYAIYNQTRVTRDRLQLADLTDDKVFEMIRFPRGSVEEICEMISGKLERPTRRSSAIPVETQVLAALQFYGTGSFQWMVGRSVGLSQTAVSGIIDDVTSALCELAPAHIAFPIHQRSILNSKLDFRSFAQFPNVLGAIDGTHIAIKAPSDAEDAFVNRKGVHTINVQGVCDSKMKLMNVVAKWPGSTHDSFMWRQSGLRKRFEDGHMPDGWLIGIRKFKIL